MTKLPGFSPIRLVQAVLTLGCSWTFALAAAQDVSPRFDEPGGSTPHIAPAPTKAERKAQRQFDMLDSNHDGRISREEATALPQLAAAFKLLDTNHDGFITMDEVKSFALLHQAEITRRRQARSD